MYIAGQCVEAAIRKLDGKADDREALAEVLHQISLTDTPRGPIQFDKYGNVVGNIYIRRVEKKGGRYVNAVVKTYPDVSQFWTYNPDEFLKHPVHNRESWPGGKNIEP